MSQSGPMRFSREFGSNILVPKMDGSINQLGDYKNKFLITHYQFIGSLFANNTYSFNRTYDNVAYPDKNNKYHKQIRFKKSEYTN